MHFRAHPGTKPGCLVRIRVDTLVSDWVRTRVTKRGSFGHTRVGTRLLPEYIPNQTLFGSYNRVGIRISYSVGTRVPPLYPTKHAPLAVCCFVLIGTKRHEKNVSTVVPVGIIGYPLD